MNELSGTVMANGYMLTGSPTTGIFQRLKYSTRLDRVPFHSDGRWRSRTWCCASGHKVIPSRRRLPVAARSATGLGAKPNFVYFCTALSCQGKCSPFVTDMEIDERR